MAHKTLINGTAYGIDGGKTLVNGTSYKVTNGKVLINGTAYDISFLLPPAALDVFGGTSATNEINCITYANGYWVVGGRYGAGINSTYYARIAYATDLNGTWTTKNIWTSSGRSNRLYNYISGIIYANGYFVVAGMHYDSSASSGKYKIRIAYATTPSGTWTSKDVWGVAGGDAAYYAPPCITYGNGYFVVGGQSDRSPTYANIAYATTPSGTWTTKTLWSSNNGSCVRDIIYANGYWVVGGEYRNVSSDGNTLMTYGRIAYATSPSGTWTTNNIWTSSETLSSPDDSFRRDHMSRITGIAYADGKWVVCGYYYDKSQSSSARYRNVIAYSTTPSGTWTTNNVWLGSNYTINAIAYANGYWVVGGNYRVTANCAAVAYTNNLTGTWTIKQLWSEYTSQNVVNCVEYFNGYVVVGGDKYNGSNHYARISYADKPSNLPA